MDCRPARAAADPGHCRPARAAADCRPLGGWPNLPAVPPRRRDPVAVDHAVAAVVRAWDEGTTPARADLALASRGLAERLAERAPGHHVELRVPPFTAVQCVPGPRHTRGTPPNVVEVDPASFVRLCVGRLAWAQAAADGRVRTWGDRADLSAWLPLGRDT